MIESIKKLIIKYKEFILYVVFGGLTTLINIIAFYLINKVISWETSNVLAWILSVLFAYITNRIYVFQSKSKNLFKEMVSFFSFRLLSLLADMAFMYLFINVIGLSTLISKVIVQVIVVILNYIFSKLFIFNSNGFSLKKFKSSFKKIQKKLYSTKNTFSNKKVFIGISVLILVLMFLLNYFTPMLADDFSYSFGMNGRLSSVKDIFEFQVHHYLTWGGRSIVHFIAQIFLLVGKSYFNVANTIIYLVFVLALYKLIVGKEKKYRYDILILINLLIWFALPVFGQNILWLVGSCNYLWGTTLVVLFLLPFRLSMDEKCSNNIIKAILMFIFGVIAGWTNENNAAAMLVLIVLFIAYRIYNKKKVKAWHITGFLGALTGFLFMILAPGNSIRSEKFANNNGMLWNLSHRFLDITNNFSKYLLPLFILTIIITVVAYYLGNCKKNKLYLTVIFVTASLCATYAMIMSPTFPDRSWMGPIVFMVIAFVNSYNCLKLEKEYVKKMIYYTVIVSSLVFVVTYYSGLRNIQKLNNNINDRIVYIEEEKAHKNYNITVTKLETYNKYVAMYGLTDVYEDKNTWLNIAVSRYFKIKSIKSEVAK